MACGTPTPTEVLQYFNSELKKRICFLDGGMGTRIQAEKLEEADYRGERFKDFSMIDANGVPVSLKGNNDLLVFSKPDMIKDIHKEYFAGGSDICETNTFNGTTISQGEYKMQEIVYEMNKVGAQLAKKAAAEVTKEEPHKPRFVAGAVGPTSRTLSVSPSVEDPSFRNVTWDELVEAYVQQIGGLVDGGVDLLMIETIFDTQNAKAAIFAVDEYFLRTGKERLPVMISATIVDNSGRTLSGQTIEAFFVSIKHAKAFTVGINCALGAAQMKKFYKMLTDMNLGWCHVYPNAGLPNAMGGYDEDPEIFSTNILDYAKDGLLNFVGGCCGTFPSHIAAVANKVKDCPPRKLPEPPKYPCMQLSGLEPCILTPDSGFQWVGERCNLMGSAKFKKLVDAYKWDEAMEVCLAQCEKKADTLDFNFDSDLIDGKSAMGKFMRLCVTEPNVAKLPFMIDSSKWPVIEEGLKCVQGKSIVNSISLKVGEEEFMRQAKLCQRFGAAVVIMAFDEQGQAATYEDKVRICQRSYRLLRSKLGFNPEDIIFDCNVLTIATGLPEHNSYALDFINAVAEIKRTCPCVSFSGGLSNLSFSFRGLNSLRDAMHSVFLYHAVPKGLNMSIVNPGSLPRCEDIDEQSRKLCEEVILNKSADGNHVERFLEFAERVKNPPAAGKDAWRNGTYTERLHHGLIHGIDKFIDGDVEEARADLQIPLKVIVGPLMQGMGIIGDLFGAGKMFLPQVIKSARVMKKAVGYLTPFMETEKRAAALAAGEDPDQPKYNGTVLMATVKGDVHDIGKNIVSVVLGCNNYRVIDMGVMVPCEKILERAVQEKVDVIGLSGLITPSLDEMVYVAEQMKVRNMKMPLMIGGATTSKRHTAVKLCTKYDHGVIHVLDASRSCTVVSSVLSTEKKSYLEDIKEEYTEIREEYYATLVDKKWKTLQQAQQMKPAMDWSKVPPKPQFIGNLYVKEHSIEEIVQYIDWTPFFQVYQLRGKYPNRGYPAIFNDERVGEEAKKLFAEAKEMLEWIIKEGILKASGVVGIWPANSVGDDIEVYPNESRDTPCCKFYGLRQQLDMGETTYWCQSDFIAPKGVAPDYIAAFACTGGLGCHEQRKIFEEKGEIDRAILLEAVADRLAEAFAELIHLKIRTTLWGYAPDEKLSLEDMLKVRYQGIRPAPGYPSQPDHREKRTMWNLLDIDRLSENKLELTESYMMLPGASVSALVFAHPEAKYFSVGQVNKDQVESYSERRGEGGVEGTERWLGSTVLGYEKK
nr:B12-dependent methionine synthase [Alexandrium insuetum]